MSCKKNECGWSSGDAKCGWGQQKDCDWMKLCPFFSGKSSSNTDCGKKSQECNRNYPKHEELEQRKRDVLHKLDKVIKDEGCPMEGLCPPKCFNAIKQGLSNPHCPLRDVMGPNAFHKLESEWLKHPQMGQEYFSQKLKHLHELIQQGECPMKGICPPECWHAIEKGFGSDHCPLRDFMDPRDFHKLEERMHHHENERHHQPHSTLAHPLHHRARGLRQDLEPVNEIATKIFHALDKRDPHLRRHLYDLEAWNLKALEFCKEKQICDKLERKLAELGRILASVDRVFGSQLHELANEVLFYCEKIKHTWHLVERQSAKGWERDDPKQHSRHGSRKQSEAHHGQPEHHDLRVMAGPIDCPVTKTFLDDVLFKLQIFCPLGESNCIQTGVRQPNKCQQQSSACKKSACSKTSAPTCQAKSKGTKNDKCGTQCDTKKPYYPVRAYGCCPYTEAHPREEVDKQKHVSKIKDDGMEGCERFDKTKEPNFAMKAKEMAAWNRDHAKQVEEKYVEKQRKSLLVAQGQQSNGGNSRNAHSDRSENEGADTNTQQDAEKKETKPQAKQENPVEAPKPVEAEAPKPEPEKKPETQQAKPESDKKVESQTTNSKKKKGDKKAENDTANDASAKPAEEKKN